ncbi:MAG: ATP-binding protein [Nocardioidaceae bacterium]
MSAVRLALAADPAHVRVVRLVAVSLGRMYGVAEQSLDDVRLAAGEACGRAVAAHREGMVDEPIVIEIEEDRGLVMTVRDKVAMPAASGERAADVLRAASAVGNLVQAASEPGELLSPSDRGDTMTTLPEAVALIEGLADSMTVTTGPSGTKVRMRWDRQR